MNAAADDYAPWEDALLAGALFAVLPRDLGGIRVHAQPGPVRDIWLDLVRDLLPREAPYRRVPVNVESEQLLGGIDLAATLRTGHRVFDRGLFEACDGGVMVLAMAERMSAGTLALVAQALDSPGTGGFGVIALDEGLEDDEAPAPALLDRLAFAVDLRQTPLRAATLEAPSPDEITGARDGIARVDLGEEVLESLVGVSIALGITSFRPVVFAARAARALAALDGRDRVSQEDARAVARLILAPRARVWPEPAAEQPPPDEAGPGEEPEPRTGEAEEPLADMILEAVRAAIPPDLLNRLKSAGSSRNAPAPAGKSGDLLPGTGRGRPAGVRRGRSRPQHRLNVIETIRAAAPWQGLRRAGSGQNRLQIRKEDFRFTRYKRRMGTTSIFVVDASGSSALHRLAEVKGAVELMLAECYVRRDQVALIAFRGTGAELILPPTRSLVRAKRCLAGLPGGGATPLAAGLDAAATLAEGLRAKGLTPAVVVMTDGRANVARDGAQDRARADSDAVGAANRLRASEISAILIDSSPRPQAAAATLATEMNAIYLPLPHANAQVLSDVVSRASVAFGP